MSVEDNELPLSINSSSEAGAEHDPCTEKQEEGSTRAASVDNIDAARGDMPVEENKFHPSNSSSEPGDGHDPCTEDAAAQDSSVARDDNIHTASEDKDSDFQLSDSSSEAGDPTSTKACGEAAVHTSSEYDIINTASKDMSVEDNELPLPLSINSSSEAGAEHDPTCSSLPMSSEEVKEDKLCVSSPTTSSEAIPHHQQTPFHFSTQQTFLVQDRPTSTMRSSGLAIGRWVISIPRSFYQLFTFCLRPFSSVWRVLIYFGSFMHHGVFVYIHYIII